jgi:hypothetical protein
MPIQSKPANIINFRIKKFNMKWVGDNKILVFLGKRNTGKSVLVVDYLFENQDFPLGTVISPTDDFNFTFKPHIPSIFIHEEYTPELVAEVLKRQKDISRNVKLDPKYRDVDPRAFLIFDDCLADGDSWARDKNIKWIFMNGRHVKITFILTMQYPMGIGPNLRTNIDYIFICKEPKISNLRRLYDHYAGIFPTFEMFRAVLKHCTKKYGCLVIDNNSTSDKLEDQVFWYRVDQDKEGFKDFRMCYPVFWKNNDKYLMGKLNPKEEPEPEEEIDYNKIVGRRNQTNFTIRQTE